MAIYLDTSALVPIYSPEPSSDKVFKAIIRLNEALIFTPLQRHELKNAIRVRVFRKEISERERYEAFKEIESDLEDGTLEHHSVSWTELFREADHIGAAHTEATGIRSFDLLHISLAKLLKPSSFLTLDVLQAQVARKIGLKVALL